MVANKSAKRFEWWRLRPAAIVLMVIAKGVLGAPPPYADVEFLWKVDAAALPTYTLYVTTNERVNVGLLGQGVGNYACVLTRGDRGFAGLCDAEELPKPAYFPPGAASNVSLDYDADGNLGVWMRTKTATLSTSTGNETYGERRTFRVRADGIVIETGLTRTLDRYAPDDDGGWSLSALRRIWWALGHGLSDDFQAVVGTSEQADLRWVSIQSVRRERWPGVWDIAFEMQYPSIIRKASWKSDARPDVSVEVATRGMRKFGTVILADEGVVHFPIRHNPVATRVMLKDFEPKFNLALFNEVETTIARAREDAHVRILDYRPDPLRPVVTRRPEP